MGGWSIISTILGVALILSATLIKIFASKKECDSLKEYANIRSKNYERFTENREKIVVLEAQMQDMDKLLDEIKKTQEMMQMNLNHAITSQEKLTEEFKEFQAEIRERLDKILFYLPKKPENEYK